MVGGRPYKERRGGAPVQSGKGCILLGRPRFRGAYSNCDVSLRSRVHGFGIARLSSTHSNVLTTYAQACWRASATFTIVFGALFAICLKLDALVSRIGKNRTVTVRRAIAQTSVELREAQQAMRCLLLGRAP